MPILLHWDECDNRFPGASDVSSDMACPRLEVAGYNYQAALRRLVGVGRLCIL